MMKVRIIGIAALLALYGGSLCAASIEEMKLSPSTLSKDCTLIDGEHAVSLQASTLYAMPAMGKYTPAKKFYQSLECASGKGTIYYYEYPGKADLESARGFAEGLVWGEGGRSAMHPEMILSAENVLLVLSSRNPEELKQQLKLPATAAAADKAAATRTYALPGHGVLQLQAPQSWRDALHQPKDGLPPIIVFSPTEGKPFEIVITPFYPPGQGMALLTLADVRKSVEKAVEEAKSQAVEKEIPIQELKGPSVTGYYFFATDKSPQAGEYKYMTQGFFLAGELAPTFTILTNDGSENVIAEALSMLKNAVYAAKQ
jgi:hypothetical protein